MGKVFVACFSDSIVHLLGRIPRNRLVFRDIFRLCLSSEPEAFIVADHQGQVAGYIFCPSDMRRLYRTAFRGGHLLRWARHWISGSYGFGWHPLRVLLLDKFSFLRESMAGRHPAEARILSIGVLPEFRGQGLGSRLLEAGLSYLKTRGVEKVRLEVRPGNLAAVRLYKNHGFEKVGSMEDSLGPWEVMIYQEGDGL